jgi:hypothetical protein
MGRRKGGAESKVNGRVPDLFVLTRSERPYAAPNEAFGRSDDRLSSNERGVGPTAGRRNAVEGHGALENPVVEVS